MTVTSLAFSRISNFQDFAGGLRLRLERVGNLMRVIGGEFRSRKLVTLPDLQVRPTPDRLRETLFNILAPRAEEYAGVAAIHPRAN
jgi:hypothetical protein